MTFRPGQSGNPGGRPKALQGLKELVQSKSQRAIERLAELVESDDERIALEASKALVDRAGLVPPKEPKLEDDEPLINHSQTISIPDLVADLRSGNGDAV